MKTIISFILSLPIIAGLDYLFLGYLMRDYYFKSMSPAVTVEFNMVFAFVFYFLFLLGIFIFAVFPNIEQASLGKTILYGAMFGFFCYMTYDLTNAATVKNWPTSLIYIDMAWGTFVSGFTAALAHTIYNFLK